jgi:hypothetical protein
VNPFEVTFETVSTGTLGFVTAVTGDESVVPPLVVIDRTILYLLLAGRVKVAEVAVEGLVIVELGVNVVVVKLSLNE